jgi:hypothetical protein
MWIVHVRVIPLSEVSGNHKSTKMYTPIYEIAETSPQQLHRGDMVLCWADLTKLEEWVILILLATMIMAADFHQLQQSKS